MVPERVLQPDTALANQKAYLSNQFREAQSGIALREPRCGYYQHIRLYMGFYQAYRRRAGPGLQASALLPNQRPNRRPQAPPCNARHDPVINSKNSRRME